MKNGHYMQIFKFKRLVIASQKTMCPSLKQKMDEYFDFLVLINSPKTQKLEF